MSGPDDGLDSESYGCRDQRRLRQRHPASRHSGLRHLRTLASGSAARDEALSTAVLDRPQDGADDPPSQSLLVGRSQSRKRGRAHRESDLILGPRRLGHLRTLPVGSSRKVREVWTCDWHRGSREMFTLLQTQGRQGSVTSRPSLRPVLQDRDSQPS